ncbi:hypothetical protein QZH41_020459, partial [Actinostola sp. cb2023]
MADGDHNFGSSKRKMYKQTTKKFGCPASVVIKEISRFPEYKITENTEKRRKRASERLRADLENNKAKGGKRVYIEFPRESDHTKHFLGQVAGISQRIDARIVDKIHGLVSEDCSVYICDFHREQAWERWLAKTSIGMTTLKSKALVAMRRIARASTVEEYNRTLGMLKDDPQLWSQPMYRRWFEKVWLRQHQRWVCAYRKDRLLVTVNTNNGVERQNLAFKYNYLVGSRSSSLSTMLTILIDEFLPESYNRYLENNARRF